jgi:hypothetical protein
MLFEGNVRVGRRRDTEEKTEGRGGRSGGGGATMNLDLDRDVGETGSQSRRDLERRVLGGHRVGDWGAAGWGMSVGTGETLALCVYIYIYIYSTPQV